MKDYPTKITIAELLNNKDKYSVPRFQRSFSWEKEQIERFWYDVVETISEKRINYFFGAIIFKKLDEDKEGNSIYEIIDGQQRLATITIFFACLRNFFLHFKENYPFDEVFKNGKEEADQIQRTYIENEKRLEDNEPKLTLNKYDAEYFNHNIQEKKITVNIEELIQRRGLLQSHKLIAGAYEVLRDKIKNELKEKKALHEKREFLKMLEETVRNFKVVPISAEYEDDAFLIFETLNERGQELCPAALIKNYIYSKAEKNNEELDRIQDNWEYMIRLLSGEKELTNFLRCYWNSCRPLARKNKLYNAFKKELEDNPNINKFVSDLKKEAEFYKDLIDPSEKKLTKKQISLLRVFRILGVKQIYPLLLSAYKSYYNRKLKSSYLNQLLEDSLITTFRYSTICNENPNKLEQIYNELAIDLITDKKNINQIKGRLHKEVYPSDEYFIKEFSRKKIKSERVARYIFIKLNKKEEEYEVDPEITLEHIMPKDIKYWEDYIKKQEIDYDELINMIGNLTLLTREKNTGLSNRPYSEKLIEYEKCPLPTTKSISEYKEWNMENAIKRQKELAERAKEIWKIKWM